MRVTATYDRAPERLVAGWLPATSCSTRPPCPPPRWSRSCTRAWTAADGAGAGSVLKPGRRGAPRPQAGRSARPAPGSRWGSSPTRSTRSAGGSWGGARGRATCPPDDRDRRRPRVGRHRRGPGDGRDHLRRGARHHRDVLLDRHRSAAGKAASINNLVAAGVKVIADDIFYLDEPMFQDGVVTQAVDAAKAAGVTYFASAGNRASQSWEGTLNRRQTTTSTRVPASTRSRRSAPSPTAAVHRAAVGRAVGRGDHRPRARQYVDPVLVASPTDHEQHRHRHPDGDRAYLGLVGTQPPASGSSGSRAPGHR